VRVKLLGLLPGTRTYECEVGATCTVKLSSKSLADLDASGSCPRTRHHPKSIDDDDGSVGDEEGSGLDAWGSVEEDEEAADTARDDIAGVSAADWRPLAAFYDQLTQRHPAFAFDNPGRLRSNVPTTPRATSSRGNFNFNSIRHSRTALQLAAASDAWGQLSSGSQARNVSNLLLDGEFLQMSRSLWSFCTRFRMQSTSWKVTNRTKMNANKRWLLSASMSRTGPKKT
jgi:hypothetical protein